MGGVGNDESVTGMPPGAARDGTTGRAEATVTPDDGFTNAVTSRGAGSRRAGCNCDGRVCTSRERHDEGSCRGKTFGKHFRVSG